MNWRPIARLMALDGYRSRGVWVVVALFAVVAAGAAGLPAVVIGESLPAARALPFVVGPMKLLVALAGLLGGYGAIAGPRAGGQLPLLLGQPVERGALVIGAFVGRATVGLSGVAVGLAVMAAAFPLVYGELPARRLAVLGGLLALFAVCITALAIGLSAMAATRGQAAVAAVAAFVLFEFFWGVVPAGAHYLVAGSLPGPIVPAWVVLLERAQPLAAFEAAAQLAVPGVEAGIRLAPGDSPAAIDRRTATLADRLDGPAPAYLDPWAAVATLVGWTVVPLAVGWHRFQHADLR